MRLHHRRNARPHRCCSSERDLPVIRRQRHMGFGLHSVALVLDESYFKDGWSEVGNVRPFRCALVVSALHSRQGRPPSHVQSQRAWSRPVQDRSR
jgi:hypothetical protein